MTTRQPADIDVAFATTPNPATWKPQVIRLRNDYISVQLPTWELRALLELETVLALGLVLGVVALAAYALIIAGVL